MFKTLFVPVLCLACITSFAQRPAISVIPEPVSLRAGQGSFTLDNTTSIAFIGDQPELRRLADYLVEKLKAPTGFKLTARQSTSPAAHSIVLQLTRGAGSGKEGYQLSATPSSVIIRADSAAGLFYGIQTLLQLMPAQIRSAEPVTNLTWSIPAVEISDRPRFGWRGTMLDVARHFFTKQQVKDLIDNIVRYKYNLLHLHLSDDQGWRLEIKSLPRLTEVGAWRAERVGKWGNSTRPSPSEPKTYGGFYTQDDIRELLQYARERFVTILPEIDIPGHSLAAVASYPELTCTTDSTYQVNAGERFINWHAGGFTALLDNTLCPANEKVYSFLDKVFTEVAELFPFEYIHMGGDECPKDFWVKNPAILALMKKENLKDMHEVQSYFVKRVEKILKSKGKKLIGWDEILEGGLPADATVMSWRGMKGGIQAAKLGHQVVMSPSTHAYVDLYQGDPVAEPPTYGMVRLRDSYAFEPVPDGVDPKLILGGQENLWTEQIQNMRAAQYMMWPRGLAVAESIWSPKEKKDWKKFTGKVENEFDRMDIGNIKYSRSMYDPIFKSFREGDKLVLEMETEIEGLDIYYSYDGSNPDNYYPAYKKPLIVPADALQVKVITYRDGKPVGKQIDMPVAELQKRAKKR